MDLLDKQLEHYCVTHSSPENDLLRKINHDTYREVLMPHMLSGPWQGRLLAMLAAMIRPKFVLEIGTFTGYSALCMAEHLLPDGLLITIDKNDELKSRVEKYFAESPYGSKIKFLVGDATKIIPTLADYSFDLVFIDADKKNYSAYYDMVLPMVQPGGCIIADNVLWSGKVLNPENYPKDKDLLYIIQFNEKIQQDPHVENVLVPIRDGLMLIRKKQ